MFKKILLYIGVTVTLAGLAGYFYFATTLYNEKDPMQTCRKIDVVLLDSLENKFVTEQEVIGIVTDYTGGVIGRKRDSINISTLEKLLDQRSAVKKSQVSITRDGKLNIEITQRRPVLRIQSQNGGFYVDETKYIFPLVETFTSYVPIVSGNIPLDLDASHRGTVNDNSKSWLDGIMELGSYIDNHPFWSAQIEQIYINQNNDIQLATRVGDIEIILGDYKDYKEKLDKLYTFYKNIVPVEGWDKYSSVNLKYKGQIICKLKKRK